ncbi:MAG TPA: sigma-70 family RNA polymerase sigma factor [Candidatus Saccharimonadales bacterium]|nr:sigma-70 family RNA polymerase sigma factor [Candidatus Saccharimonadales bacterium]
MDDYKEFESMYRANEPKILRFMFWRTRDQMAAQDLTSSVFEKAWRTRDSFKGGSQHAWLWRIARTTVIDYWRKKKDIAIDTDAVELPEENERPIEEVLDQQIMINKLEHAVGKLPVDMFYVVHFRFIAGLSARETAQRMGKSEANVRVLQYRALKKLKGYLE